MINRRNLAGIALSAGLAPVMTKTARAADDCVAFDADMQKATSPDAAIDAMKNGNARFVSGQSLHCDLLAEAKATEAKQTPFACVLGCIDSRVPPELVFDQQIGDIFVARVAGNVATPEILGSFEYATKVAGAKAIVVLGHSSCGAVKGCIDKVKVGDNLTTLLNEIEPVVEGMKIEGERSSKNHELVQHVAEANVLENVKKMTAASSVLKELVDAGQLKVVGAMHDLHTGKITFL